MANKTRHFLIGIGAGTVLLLFYFGLLTALNSFGHALTQFSEIWPWIIALAIGFGVQAGLFSYTRSALKEKAANAGKSVAAAGSVSGTSMVLCCLHHITDVVPILGVSAAAIFLVQYQVLFLLLGVLSNIVGITMMLEIIQKNNLAGGIFTPLFAFDMNTAKKTAAVASVLVLSIAAITMAFPQAFLFSASETGAALPIEAGQQLQETALPLSKQSNAENMVTVEVTPVGFEFGKPAEFNIALNTHSVDLGFDLTEIATLYDSSGRPYKAVSWSGSPPGGHHRNGTLSFPSIGQDSKSMVLVLKGIANVPERKFEWNLE